jgi:hypothetical protein
MAQLTVPIEKPLKNRGRIRISGEGGIRTLGRLASTPVFETGPIGRSGTSPGSVVAIIGPPESSEKMAFLAAARDLYFAENLYTVVCVYVLPG